MDPLSELCGPCVELLDTSWARRSPMYRNPICHIGVDGRWARGYMPHVSTPQLHSPASLQKSKTYSLVWHSLEFFVWKESTYQAWRRLRSRWSSTIIHRVLKLQNIVNSELLASIKLCKLTVCLSIFLNCGTPLKIAKFISYIFFEKPCTVFNNDTSSSK